MSAESDMNPSSSSGKDSPKKRSADILAPAVGAPASKKAKSPTSDAFENPPIQVVGVPLVTIVEAPPNGKDQSQSHVDPSAGTHSDSDDDERPKSAPGSVRRRFSSRSARDIALLRELLRYQPHFAPHGRTQTAWQQVTDALNASPLFAADGTQMKWKAARDRAKLLETAWRRHGFQNMKKSANDDRFEEKRKLLAEYVAELDAALKEKSGERRPVSRKRVDDAPIVRPVEDLTQEVNRKSQADDMDDSASDTSSHSDKRLPVVASPAIAVIAPVALGAGIPPPPPDGGQPESHKRRWEQELTVRKEELELQQQKLALEQRRLALEERKFELEAEERRQRLDLERLRILTEKEERKIFLQMITKGAPPPS